jgi:hypothetical protein
MTNQPKKFQRNIEDFVCEHCGKVVKGNGYTNHCPYCLWSKHVDVNPGDRANDCQGMMEPIDVEFKNGKKFLIHKCEKCGFEKNNKVQEEDNLDKVLEIINKKNREIFYG